MSTLDDPRETGPLHPPREVTELLAELRAEANVSTDPDLDVDNVRDVERAAGVRFEDDLLAVFAAALPSVADGLQMRLAMVVGHLGELRERGAPGHLIGIGRDSEGRHLCVTMRRRDGSATEIVTWDPAAGVVDRKPLLDLLRDLRADAPAAGGQAGTFCPRLIPRPLESQRGVKVVHAVFGEGVVITETGTGPNRKVKVDFPGAGLKLLQARFLRWL